jgi:hypothetical protein
MAQPAPSQPYTNDAQARTASSAPRSPVTRKDMGRPARVATVTPRWLIAIAAAPHPG